MFTNLRNASLFGLAFSFLAFAALFVRGALIASTRAGIGIQALSLAVMIWARLTFGRRSFHASPVPTEGGVITNGPYRYVRHPIYAAALYLAWAGILTNLSPVNFILGLVPTAGLAVRMLSEERLLREKYPEYSAYAARTRRAVPFIL